MIFDQFIKEYSRKGLIKPQKTSFTSIERLISRSYKEIKVAEANLKIDEGIAFTIAYTAMLHAGRALMLFKGYRPSDGYQHKTVVDFAAIILGEKYKTLVQHFDKMRKKRNIFTYEVSISISETEVKNALKSAIDFIKAVRHIIEKENPQHTFKF
ncbi:MAG: HEPN domain-containing protein [Candidatus Omnitrophica bacterium]|nr:HEPN domain-containing protein [Candidatus Omnitrophota bacterium]